MFDGGFDLFGGTFVCLVGFDSPHELFYGVDDSVVARMFLVGWEFLCERLEGFEATDDLSFFEGDREVK